MAMAEGLAWGVSRILGSTLPIGENWLDDQWLEALFGLSSHGVQLSAFQSWAEYVAGGYHESMLDVAHSEDVRSPEEVLHIKALPGAWGVSQILGTTLPTGENWTDDEWVQALFALSSCGVELAAFHAWSRDVALGNSITAPDPAPDVDTGSSRKRGLMELLPNLLTHKEGLQSKSPELQEYVRGLDERRFYERDYLEGVKAHLEEHRFEYWPKRPDVTIGIQLSVRLGSRSADVSNCVPQRIRDFYNSHPQARQSRRCEQVKAGSDSSPWVMQCGDSLGVHVIKKAAKMIAVIKECIDPSFDPEGDSPPPPKVVSKKMMERKRKHEESMTKMAAVSSTDDDAEEVAHKKCLTEVDETTK